jgi:nicotinamidase-related amidase
MNGIDLYTGPDFERSALISIDMQNDFTLPESSARIEGTGEIVDNLAGLMRLYRTRNLPIIHVVRLYLPDGSNVDLCRRKSIEDGRRIVLPGSDGAEIVDELTPEEYNGLNPAILLSGRFQQISGQEYVMYKPRWGAFYRTHLEGFLNVLQVNTLVFAGCNFPNCPRATVYQASERDFRLVLVRDAVSRLSRKDERELKAIAVTMVTTSGLHSIINRRQGPENKIKNTDSHL